jgi:hypothetical protein
LLENQICCKLQEAQMLAEVRGQAIVSEHAKVVDLEKDIAAGKAELERKRGKKRSHKMRAQELEQALRNAVKEKCARAEGNERELQMCLVRVERVEAQVRAICDGRGRSGECSAAQLQAEMNEAKKHQTKLEGELVAALRVRTRFDVAALLLVDDLNQSLILL